MKKKFGLGTIEVSRIYSGGGKGYDPSGQYYGTGLPVYSVTYEDDERDPYTGERGRWITVEVRARSISEAIEAAGDEITRRLRMPRSEWGRAVSRRRAVRAPREAPSVRARPSVVDPREGLYRYRGASIEISGPAGGRWYATVRFRNQEEDIEARSAKEAMEAAMNWIDEAPELNEPRARRPAERKRRPQRPHAKEAPRKRGWVIRLRPNPDEGYSGPSDWVRDKSGSIAVYSRRETAVAIAQGISAAGRWWPSVMSSSEIG